MRVVPPGVVRLVLRHALSARRALCRVRLGHAYGAWPVSLPSSLPWTVNLLVGPRFLKASWRRDPIELEARNLDVAQALRATSKYVLDHALRQVEGYHVLEVEAARGPPQATESFEAARAIVTDLESDGALGPWPGVARLPEAARGLELVAALRGESSSEALAARADRALAGEQLPFGPAHGDLHPGNILLRANGTPCLVDFDCFRRRGLQLLDRLNFVVQHFADASSASWLHELRALAVEEARFREPAPQLLLGLLPGASLRALSLVYFLDRLGQEAKYAEAMYVLDAAELSATVDFFLADGG